MDWLNLSFAIKSREFLKDLNRCIKKTFCLDQLSVIDI